MWPYLTLNTTTAAIDKNQNDSAIKTAKYAVRYDEDKDPVEFFSTKAKAEARIQQLIESRTVKLDSIWIMEIANQSKVGAIKHSYDLIPAKQVKVSELKVQKKRGRPSKK